MRESAAAARLACWGGAARGGGGGPPPAPISGPDSCRRGGVLVLGAPAPASDSGTRRCLVPQPQVDFKEGGGIGAESVLLSTHVFTSSYKGKVYATCVLK